MKNQYEPPIAEVIIFPKQDVLVASSDTNNPAVISEIENAYFSIRNYWAK